MLMNYSVSTLFRAILLSEGFYVGAGAPTGPKAETTIAFSVAPVQDFEINSLLGSAWLQKWERSGARVPADLEGLEKAEFEAKVRNHRQFQIDSLQKPLR
jgi:queuine tRNA-ribosyltransferase